MAGGVKRNASKEPQTRTKKPRAASKIVKAEEPTPQLRSDDASSEEEPMRQEDIDAMEHTIMSVCNKAKKPDTWAKDFRKNVDQNEANVLTKLGQVKENLAADKVKYERLMLKLLSTALGPLNDEDQLTDLDEPNQSNTGGAVETARISVSHVAVDTQQYFSVITGLVRDSHKLINSYKDHKDQQVAPSRLGDLGTAFQKDREAATTAVAAGRKIVICNVEEMLADPHHAVKAGTDLTAKDVERGRSMLARASGEGRKAGMDFSWGEVAREMAKAARYLEGDRR